jgi:nicotinamidase-related amidase
MLPSFKNSTLLVVDVQARLLPAMHEEDRDLLIKEITILVQAVAEFGGNILYSEQYPQGLGSTVASLAECLKGCPRLEKKHFSVCKAPGYESHKPTIREDVVLVGLETHVCVLETGLDLLADGHRVWVPLDAVASRRPAYRDNGLELLRDAGATVVNTETLVFHQLESADSQHFKRFSRLIR